MFERLVSLKWNERGQTREDTGLKTPLWAGNKGICEETLLKVTEAKLYKKKKFDPMKITRTSA